MYTWNILYTTTTTSMNANTSTNLLTFNIKVIYNQYRNYYNNIMRLQILFGIYQFVKKYNSFLVDYSITKTKWRLSNIL